MYFLHYLNCFSACTCFSDESKDKQKGQTADDDVHDSDHRRKHRHAHLPFGFVSDHFICENKPQL